MRYAYGGSVYRRHAPPILRERFRDEVAITNPVGPRSLPSHDDHAVLQRRWPGGLLLRRIYSRRETSKLPGLRALHAGGRSRRQRRALQCSRFRLRLRASLFADRARGRRDFRSRDLGSRRGFRRGVRRASLRRRGFFHHRCIRCGMGSLARDTLPKLGASRCVPLGLYPDVDGFCAVQHQRHSRGNRFYPVHGRLYCRRASQRK